jgi:hypothetical protein
MHDRESCGAGVRFQELPGYGNKGFMETCPCFGPQPISICEKSAYPTKEELAAREAEIRQRLDRVFEARSAIVKSIGEWKQGSPGANGHIDCPVCLGEKTLRFGRAECNGHIRAACTTEDCVRWIE